MYRECRHIRATGRKCKSPAVNGQLFCFFHFDSRRHAKDGLENRDEPLILPSLEDIAGIQIALMQVTNALASGRLTNKQPGNGTGYLLLGIGSDDMDEFGKQCLQEAERDSHLLHTRLDVRSIEDEKYEDDYSSGAESSDDE